MTPQEKARELRSSFSDVLFDEIEGYYQKQIMNPYSSDSQSYTAYEKGFIEGFEKAKENLYTEEQVIEFTMNMISQYVQGNTNIWNRELLKESLKQ